MWLLPALIASACAMSILIFVYLYLYYTERRKYFILWSFSWIIYFIRFILVIADVQLGGNIVLSILYLEAALISTAFLMYGTFNYIDKKVDKIYLILGIANAIWIILASLLRMPFLALTLPSFLFMGFVYIMTGVAFIKGNMGSKFIGRVLGIVFIMWGVHKFDYPLVRNVDWFAPIGYILVQMFAMSVAVGILVLYFQKSKEKQIESEQDIIQNQKELEYEKQKFERYIDEAPYGIFVSNEKGNYLNVNKEACRLTGYSENELLSMTVRDLSDEKDIVPLHKEGVGAKLEIEYLTKTGVQRTWRVNAVKLSDKKNIAFTEDITDILKIEKQIEKTREETKALFDNTGLAIRYYKPNGEIIWFNKFAAEYSNEKSEYFIGKSIYDFWTKKEADEYIELIKEAIATKEPVKSESVTEYQKDKKWFLNIYNAIFNDNKELLGVEVISQDITELRKIEISLKESEKKYRNIFEQANIGIFNLSITGEFLNANNKFCDLIGYSIEELLKLSIYDITLKDDLEDTKKRMINFVSGDINNINIEKKYLRKDGRIINTLLTSYLLNNNDNKPLYTISTIQDITEQNKLEEERKVMDAHLNQQQRLESVGTLASGVAHEINNPLNGIMNYGQLILDSSDTDSEHAEFASEIINESNRVSTIVKDLLQFSRDEKQEHSYASIEDIINNTISLIKTVVKQDQIDLQIDIPEGLPQLKCRSQQIQQVIMNLVTNARDALNEKYEGYHENKKIILTCEETEKYGRAGIRVIIEDHGNGIPEAIKENIFEPFFTSKSRDKGTGLGLSISHGIVEEHHGDLSFETKEGKYTKFIMDLPCNNGWVLEKQKRD